jgi:hypothetical protein
MSPKSLACEHTAALPKNQSIFPSVHRSLKTASVGYGGILRSDSVAVLAEGGTVQGAACLFVVPVLFVTFSMIECRKDGREEMKDKAHELKFGKKAVSPGGHIERLSQTRHQE